MAVSRVKLALETLAERRARRKAEKKAAKDAKKPHLPQSPEELTAEWFTGVLAESSNGATVTGVSHQIIGAGIGFVGDVIRCRLEWDSDAPGLPASVVAKVPSTIRQNRMLGEGLMAYEREITLYRERNGRLGLPMPVHVHSEMDPNPAPWLARPIEWLLDHLPIRGVGWLVDRLLDIPDAMLRRYLLVMEDIDDARPAAQFDGGSLDDAHVLLGILADFHAQNWMNQELVDEQPLIWSVARTPKVFQATYRRNRAEFETAFGSVVGPEVIARLDRVQEEVPDLMRQLAQPPWTILHGDYRLDNLLFRSSGDVVVLDYQLLLWGRPGWDVGYFITTALAPEHKSEEAALLDTYHQALVAKGVADYSAADLYRDVHITKELLAHRMVGTTDVINTEVEGRDQSFVDLMVCRVTGWL